MVSPQIHSLFNLPPKLRQGNFGPSLTQQHKANECDINQIMARYRVTGLVSHITGKAPLFGDYTAIGDFRAIQDKILSANSAFMELSSKVRKRFHNDPAEFVEFCQDPDNHSEAFKLGLIASEPAEKVIDGSQVSTPPASALAAVVGVSKGVPAPVAQSST